MRLTYMKPLINVTNLSQKSRTYQKSCNDDVLNDSDNSFGGVLFLFVVILSVDFFLKDQDDPAATPKEEHTN